jgi:hypothetical protein
VNKLHVESTKAQVQSVLFETTLGLVEAAQFLPRGRNSSRPHLSTLLRWILTGAKSPTGEVVRLEAVRLGSKWITSREALARFAERLTPSLADIAAEQRAPRSPSARQRASQRAAKELERVGI